MKIRNYVMHRTNPLYVFSRIVTVLDWYDRMWSRVFGVKRLTKKQIIEFINKARKKV